MHGSLCSSLAPGPASELTVLLANLADETGLGDDRSGVGPGGAHVIGDVGDLLVGHVRADRGHRRKARRRKSSRQDHADDVFRALGGDGLIAGERAECGPAGLCRQAGGRRRTGSRKTASPDACGPISLGRPWRCGLGDRRKVLKIDCDRVQVAVVQISEALVDDLRHRPDGDAPAEAAPVLRYWTRSSSDQPPIPCTASEVMLGAYHSSISPPAKGL